jgi:hypothetical protein
VQALTVEKEPQGFWGGEIYIQEWLAGSSVEAAAGTADLRAWADS